MFQITQAPTAPVQIRERFIVSGVASAEYAGKDLTLVIDGQYRTKGPTIGADGRWSVDFLFTQAGSRRLRIEVGNEGAEITVRVQEAAPAARLRITSYPQQLTVGKSGILEGEAIGYNDGVVLTVQADGRYELARPQVLIGKWQAAIGFNQAGARKIEVIGIGTDRAEVTINVVAVAPPPPRPPRLRFINPPTRVQAEQVVVLRGDAEGYNNGDQLVLRADQIYELARPRVQSEKWEAPILLREVGRRTITLIGSEQDRAEITLEVVQSPTAELVVLPRSTWTNNPTPTSLPSLQPRRITLHHTALSSAPPVNAAQSQDAERMRLIWRSHVDGNGWSDIGYHFIIMPSGRVFEARSERRRGAHDVVNDGLGVAFDGIFSSATISQQQFNSAIALCTQLCRRYGFRDPVTPVPTPTADFGTRNLPLILGHRDRVNTQCPGTEGGRTVRLPEIRQAVKARLQ